MGNVEINLVGGVARRDQRFLDHPVDFLDGVAKHFAAIHAQMTNGLGRARTTIDVEQVFETSIGADSGLR